MRSMTKRAEVCGVWSLKLASWSWARAAGVRMRGNLWRFSAIGVWSLSRGTSGRPGNQLRVIHRLSTGVWEFGSFYY